MWPYVVAKCICHRLPLVAYIQYARTVPKWHFISAYLILKVDVSTLSDQLPHNLLAALLCMHHERCRAVSSPLVHLCSLLDQLLHHLCSGALEQSSTSLTSLEENVTTYKNVEGKEEGRKGGRKNHKKGFIPLLYLLSIQCVYATK